MYNGSAFCLFDWRTSLLLFSPVLSVPDQAQLELVIPVLVDQDLATFTPPNPFPPTHHFRVVDRIPWGKQHIWIGEGFVEYMEATLKDTLTPLLPNLRSLHVHWNTCITDEFLSWASQAMPRLQVRWYGFTIHVHQTASDQWGQD